MAKRKKKKVNPYRQPITKGTIAKAKRDGVAQAIDYCWAVTFICLHDEFGFGHGRLVRLWKAMESYSESIITGGLKLESVFETLEKECDITLDGKRR